MVFTEEVFLYYFLPLVLLFYYLLPFDGDPSRPLLRSARKVFGYLFVALIPVLLWAFFRYLVGLALRHLPDSLSLDLGPAAQGWTAAAIVLLLSPLLVLYGNRLRHNPQRSPYWLRNLWLTLMGYLFYSWFEPWFVIPMFATNVLDFWWGVYLGRDDISPKRRKTALVFSMITNLGLLGIFKYGVFTQVNLNRLLEAVGQPMFEIFMIGFPLGISFYTFHSMSYIIDIYRGERPVKSFADFSCFVSLFPQLVAGPILRYNVLSQQLHSRQHSLNLFARGVLLFFLGFAMKILLANPVGKIADAAFAADAPRWFDAWWGVTAYAFQIYFDFNGYSVMALGLGQMFGFALLRNFNDPYHSDSITDFWRRWHISLSTWLREYLYIPLGGNRKGEARTYFNLAMVMLLGGFWHGAQWQFLIWGAIHGTMLGIERWSGKRPFYGAMPRQVRVGITLFVILITWVFFRAEDLPHAGSFLAAMFGFGGSNPFTPMIGAQMYTLSAFVDMALCAIIVYQPLQSYEYAAKPLTWGRFLLAYVLFLFAVVMMYTQAFNPFLYFQF